MFNIMSRPPLYDQDAVQPMRDALIAVGFKQMITPKDVDEAINVNDDQTVLVMINSVCGCAAGSARPGVSLALQHSVIPDRLITGFAGQEREAVDKIRQYITGYPPSSPSIAMFKNGKLMYFMQRYNIEGRSAEEISSDLREAFDELCTKQGPSIPHDVFEKVTYAVQCGSKIPLYKA
ncbi:MAG TPA: BrxA/BrxB family bacilliredoxin [Ignavibacteriaceae bacterium]|jgi:putative YphP/YqiW family bacilliredoxin|nr:BrxA/BrxB family bacilliredoxin [Ignavibacteriaceae bacterium]